MNEFIGTKMIKATEMNRRDYNIYRGWDMPKNEDGNDEGYLVEYLDGGPANDPTRHAGYISWSPKEVFDNSYQSTSAMNFGHALDILKRGEAVCRKGWNGKRMFLYLVPAPEKGYPAQQGIAKKFWGEDALVPYGGYIAMKTADGMVVPWLCSQTDALADDWMIVDIDDLVE